MRKKTLKKRNIIIGILFFSILIGVLLSTGVVQQAVYGSSYLSISNVQVDGTNQIRVFGVTNGAENLIIDWSPNDFNSYLPADQTATKSVTGSIKLIDPKRKFRLDNRLDQPFFYYTAEQVSVFSNCQNNVPSGYVYAGEAGTTLTKRNCLYKRSVGNFGQFNNQFTDDIRIFADIGGSTGSLNPSTGNNVLTLNDGKTKIEWVGNLANTQGITAPNQYGAWFQNSQFIALIDSNAYSNSRNHIQTLINEIGVSNIDLNGFIMGGVLNLKSFDKIQSAVGSYNNKLGQELERRENQYLNSINAEDVYFSGNDLVVDLKTATSFPTFTITLPAEKVGIVSLKGKPQIVSCPTKQEITSGQSLNPVLKVKNIGDSGGSFYGTLTCTNSNIQGTISERFFNKGQTQDMPLQLSGIAQTSDISGSCTARVIDRKSGDSDSCNFQVEVTYQPNVVCDPNSVSCFGADVLRTCNSDGSSFSDFTCKNGCEVISNSDDQCIGQQPIPNECLSVQLECSQKAQDQPWLGWTFKSETKDPAGVWKFFGAKSKTSCICRASFLIWYVLGGVLLAGFTALLVSSKIKKKGKRK